MTTLAIIQARMGSTRYPGKVLAPIGESTVLAMVLRACERAGVEAVVAVPPADRSGPLVAYVESLSYRWYAPMADAADVLGRFLGVLEHHQAVDEIVRVTSDCPLVDHRTIIELIAKRREHRVPYIWRMNDPDGNDCEVFSAEFLRRIAHPKTPAAERQHVCAFMRQQRYGARYDPSGQSLSDVHYSVDTIATLATCARLLEHCGEGASWQDYVRAYRGIQAGRPTDVSLV